MADMLTTIENLLEECLQYIGEISQTCHIAVRDGGTWGECDVCGSWFPYPFYEGYELNYCPHCGAKAVKR